MYLQIWLNLDSTLKMYEDTIEEILEKDLKTKKCFLGAFAKDEIPTKINSFPCCFIINTENRSEPGEHWLAVYINNQKIAQFFYSYGLPPSYYQLEAPLKKISRKINYNQRQIQGTSTYCGLYCVLFLLFAVRNNLNSFYNQFSTDFIKNDFIISYLIKNDFN